MITVSNLRDLTESLFLESLKLRKNRIDGLFADGIIFSFV